MKNWKEFKISVMIGVAVAFYCFIILNNFGISVGATKFAFFHLPAWSYLISAAGIYIFLCLKKSKSQNQKASS